MPFDRIVYLQTTHYKLPTMSPISQKAHDISFAVFRVAKLIKNSKLRRELEDSAVELVVGYEAVANPSLFTKSATIIDILERLVTLAESIKEISGLNAKVLKRELFNLQMAIVHSASVPNGKEAEKEVNLEEMFPLSGNTIMPGDADARLLETVPTTIRIQDSQIGKSLKLETDADIELTKNALQSLSERQMAILDNIRQFEFCRLRNLVESMSNISERTIRNEILSLIELGLVRRVGGGGPSSYFQLTGIRVPSVAKH